MSVTFRNYRLLNDFENVHRFLQNQYTLKHHNGYLLPQFFEYAQTHPAFDYAYAHRIGIWEDKGDIVGIATYEMGLGEAFLLCAPGYEALYENMLEYAKKELSKEKDGEKKLYLWTTDGQKALLDRLEKSAYEIVDEENITSLPYDKKLPMATVPKGYRITTLDDQNDILKIHHCLWKGFNHGDEPDSDFECRRQMQSGPHFRPDLTTVVIAPDGSYACFCGMWYDEVNQYAYIEPLATVPEHRKLGLGRSAILHAVQKSQSIGATYCYGGPMDFYLNMGFKVVGKRLLYKIL